MFGHSNVEFSYLCFLVYIRPSFLKIYIIRLFSFARTLLRSLIVCLSDCLNVYYHIYLLWLGKKIDYLNRCGVVVNGNRSRAAVSIINNPTKA